MSQIYGTNAARVEGYILTLVVTKAKSGKEFNLKYCSADLLGRYHRFFLRQTRIEVEIARNIYDEICGK